MAFVLSLFCHEVQDSFLFEVDDHLKRHQKNRDIRLRFLKRGKYDQLRSYERNCTKSRNSVVAEAQLLLTLDSEVLRRRGIHIAASGTDSDSFYEDDSRPRDFCLEVF